jgi:hypothetical protein
LPHGIQSGLKRDFKGIFFYFKYIEEYHLWFLYDALRDEFINSKTEILKFISCPPEERRVVLDDLDVFEIHWKVRERIKELLSEELIATQVRLPSGRKEKFLQDMMDELEYLKEEILYEDETFCSQISDILRKLNEISFTKKRMQRLRRVWKEYKASKSWHQLIRQLFVFLHEKAPVEALEPQEYDENKLKLICVDFIS